MRDIVHETAYLGLIKLARALCRCGERPSEGQSILDD